MTPFQSTSRKIIAYTVCRDCNGTGVTKDLKTCDRCNGSGKLPIFEESLPK